MGPEDFDDPEAVEESSTAAGESFQKTLRDHEEFSERILAGVKTFAASDTTTELPSEDSQSTVSKMEVRSILAGTCCCEWPPTPVTKRVGEDFVFCQES